MDVQFGGVAVPMALPARAGRSARTLETQPGARAGGVTGGELAVATPLRVGVGARIGAYRIERPLGAGGMCEVWVGEHALLGRRAAIKLLRAELSSQREIVHRFFNEARAMTAVASPGIVQIFDFGFHDDGRAYIAMELLDGETLEHRLQRLGALAVPEALHLARQIAGALRASHAHGIVHRDLKPENIFLARDPEMIGGERAKLLDFGIAKLLGERSARVTQDSVILGTPTFMSPEQCRHAGDVDPQSDIYALGCVLFTLITGRPPFDADAATEVMAMHLCDPPVAPSQRAEGVPPAVDALVLRCLAKDPADRPTADDLVTEISGLFGAPRTRSARFPRFSQVDCAVGRARAPFSGAFEPRARPRLAARQSRYRRAPGDGQPAIALAAAVILVSATVGLVIFALSLLAI